MHKVKVSSKNQVTIPIEICRKLNVRKGSRLVMEIADGRIVITPEPDNYTKYYYSMAKGTYGNTVREIEAGIQAERRTWD